MGVGYIVGCLASILLWNVERQAFFRKLDGFIKKFFESKVAAYVFYVLGILIMSLIAIIFWDKEIANFITAFLVIDISLSERENMEAEDMRFNATIGKLCRSLVCGMTAPLFYVLLFGNVGGIIYFALYNICYVGDYAMFDKVLSFLTVIPGLLVQLIFYMVYIFKSKKLAIDFKGDYLINIVKRPLLNLEITAANIESISFYYHFQEKEQSFVKLYGKEENQITDNIIIGYLSTLYIAAIFIFLAFLALYVIKTINFLSIYQ